MSLLTETLHCHPQWKELHLCVFSFSLTSQNVSDLSAIIDSIQYIYWYDKEKLVVPVPYYACNHIFIFPWQKKKLSFPGHFPVVTQAGVFSGDELFCKVTRELAAGERLLASLSPPLGSSSSPLAHLSTPLSLVTQKQLVVKEEPLYPAALHSDIQLLPQQAGMAAILATAVVNSECCILRHKKKLSLFLFVQ